jgi:pyruvate kinase
MLSEETAMGNFPEETVAYMRKIDSEAENFLLENRHMKEPGEDSGTQEYLAYTACLLAEKTNAHAMVAHSISGGSARLLASCRPRQLTHVLTPDNVTMRALNFTWGVQPHTISEDPEVSHLVRVEHFIANTNEFPAGKDVVITAGEPTPGQPNSGTNLVKIYRK